MRARAAARGAHSHISNSGILYGALSYVCQSHEKQLDIAFYTKGIARAVPLLAYRPRTLRCVAHYTVSANLNHLPLTLLAAATALAAAASRGTLTSPPPDRSLSPAPTVAAAGGAGATRTRLLPRGRGRVAAAAPPPAAQPREGSGGSARLGSTRAGAARTEAPSTALRATGATRAAKAPVPAEQSKVGSSSGRGVTYSQRTA